MTVEIQARLLTDLYRRLWVALETAWMRAITLQATMQVCMHGSLQEILTEGEGSVQLTSTLW
jgi:hypothetical protein